MRKISFVRLAMCISIALVLVVALEAGWFTAQPLANSALDSNKLAEKHFGKAIGLLKQENYQEAIEEYNKVIKLLPDSLIAQDAQYWIGQTYLRMGELDRALSIFEKLIKDYPGSAIIPVTQLMIAQVQQAKESEKLQAKRDAALDKKVIIDAKTGAKYTKAWVLTGKKDVIDSPNMLKISPNGKFLLDNNIVIPLKGEEPFNLVDPEAWRGVWSPDGEKVAFYSGEAICVIPVSPETGRPTGPAKKLLDGKYRFQHHVSWSPDSERIVFHRMNDKPTGDIWTLSLKDGALTRITDSPIAEFCPGWSPDGKTIAYIGKGSEIWVVSAKGGKPRKIIDLGDWGSLLCWSPDSKWIVFTKGRNLHLFRFADERVFDIDPPDDVGDFFSWSTDGKKMLFYRSSYDFSNVLKVVSASGGPSFQLGREVKLSPYTHFWSPDSKMIITDGFTPKPVNSGVWIIPLAGAEASPLKLDVSLQGKLHSLALSPDRERLLFSVERGDGKEDLYVIPISLKEAQSTGPPVLVFSEWDCWLGLDNWSWSSDGKKLALIHKGDIWIKPVEKGKPVQITKTAGDEILPEWSPAGEMIVYIVQVEQIKKTLYVIPASGGESTKILDNCSYWSHAWSPDGKEIVAESEGMILAIPIDGGKSRQILDLKEQGIVDGARGLCWLQDGKHLAFISKKMGLGEPTRIFVVPSEGGKVIELASDDDGWKDWIYASPDGKWISYNAEDYVKTRPEGTIWEVDVEQLLRGLKKQQEK
jgi:Tol biopolymer transport system component